MKSLIVTASILLLTACASNPNLARHDENDKLCEAHKSDFQYYQAAFDKEHDQVCAGGCVYNASMTKNSDTMERIAGLYYMMNCDSNHGRL